jgi:hypothetical protein
MKVSHIVSIRTEVRDRQAVERACNRLGLAAPDEGEAKIFATTKKGLLVRLEGWQFPLVCDLASGAVDYDNYGGHWGDPKRLDQFLQAYAVEKSTLEARKKGYSVVEQPLADGSIKLVIGVAGEGA